VSVDATDADAGQVSLEWRSPFQANKTQFPPPYNYVVLRSANSLSTSNLKAVNPGKLSDSTFADTGLNTTFPNIYYYRILAYASNGNFIDSSAMASSVQLIAKPGYKNIRLNWSASVPWTNNTMEYPMHWIYRGKTGAAKISDLTLIDSVNVNTNQFTYLDSGQYNATPLEDTQTYCYAVMTKGSYGDPLIKTPILNFSEISASVSAITGVLSTQPGITLYPNPVESNFEITGIEGEINLVQGFDATGRPINLLLIQNENGYEADVRSLTTGLYLLRVQTGIKILQFKFIKR
jgi:Secretion system C-terminal sorting domain